MKRLAVLVPAALLLLPPILHAEDTEPAPAADDAVAMRALAARLNSEADDIRRVATDAHAVAHKECWRKFMVSKCQSETDQTLRDEKLKAAKLESRARAIERELKRREVAERDAKRAEKEGVKPQP